ncbi:PRC and DUF2382 domain-containing protein [Kitasatospora sp. NPDC088351]|uniref:PRC and DUF2382 domain-containing protein n=1 Tax=Kitasatospora sp. NPDC088351 TaxID=3155180 RepID=UPI00342CC9DE
MQTDIDPRDLIGHKAVDRNGDKIGTVDEVYLDDATGQPEWAAVRTGIFGRDAFVPLTTSEFSGDELRVPYDKSLVKESPDFGVGQHLSPAQELQLYRYYGLDTPADDRSGPDADQPADLDFGAVPPAEKAADAAGAGAAAGVASTAAAPAKHLSFHSADAAPPAGPLAFHSADTAPAKHATTPAVDLGKPSGPARETASGAGTATAPAAAPRPQTTEPDTPAVNGAPAVDGAPVDAARPAPPAPGSPVELTCREERLEVTTEWHVLGTAKLRKYVITEAVEHRVPVVRERVRVERTPVSEAERALITNKEIAESVEEVTLREERPVVRKYLAPVERVRLVVERYTTEEVIRDELRREHIEVHDATAPAPPPATASVHTPAPPAAHTPHPATAARAVDEPAREAPVRPLI